MCALLLAAMHKRGYRLDQLRRKLSRQLHLWPGSYDATPAHMARAEDAELRKMRVLQSQRGLG
jgi:hypothetical protein